MSATAHRAGAAAIALAVLVTAEFAQGGSLVVYGTAPGQSGPDYPGGTILEGDTVRIDDGGTVTGDVANSGTLQFNQTSGSLAVTGTYTGSPTATLSLTNGGTVSLLQSTTSTIIDGAVNVQAGLLTTGTSALFIGSTGTGSLSISGNGSVATTLCSSHRAQARWPRSPCPAARSRTLPKLLPRSPSHPARRRQPRSR